MTAEHRYLTAPEGPDQDRAWLAMQRHWSAQYRLAQGIADITPFSDRPQHVRKVYFGGRR